MIRRVAAALPRCRVVPVADLRSAPGGRARFMDKARLLYIDDDHLRIRRPPAGGRIRRSAALGALGESPAGRRSAKGGGIANYRRFDRFSIGHDADS
ncbi:MAG: hypothetical protein U1F77_04435 [Kiritimatiellia bacterium]